MNSRFEKILATIIISASLSAAFAQSNPGTRVAAWLHDALGNNITSTGGSLNVNLTNGGGGGTASSFGVAFPSAGTAAGGKDSSTSYMDPLTVNNADGGLHVHLLNGGSGGTSSEDNSAFVYGTTFVTTAGCSYNSTITNLTSGNSGAVSCTVDRQVRVNASQFGSWNVGQSGAWSVGQAGTWNVGLQTGTNAIGSITNTAFGASQAGSWNVGLQTGTNAIGSITNTAFGVTGALPTGTNNIGQIEPTDGTHTQLFDPCQSAAKIYIPISQTTNTQIATGTSGLKNYVCSLLVVGSDAENISLVEGTGTTCGTSPVAIVGGTTAASGPNLSANGGFSLGNGGNAVAAGTTNADNVCLFQSGTGRVAGVLVLAQR